VAGRRAVRHDGTLAAQGHHVTWRLSLELY
jgi:hypothetical protein